MKTKIWKNLEVRQLKGKSNQKYDVMKEDKWTGTFPNGEGYAYYRYRVSDYTKKDVAVLSSLQSLENWLKRN